jgi:hypothetical protein
MSSETEDPAAWNKKITRFHGGRFSVPGKPPACLKHRTAILAILAVRKPIRVYGLGCIPCKWLTDTNKEIEVRTRTYAALAAFTILLGAALFADDGGNGQNNETRFKTRLAGSSIQGKTPEGNADFRSE